MTAEPHLMDDALQDLGGAIAAGLGHAVVRTEVAFGQLSVYAQADAIVEAMTFLRDDPRCQFICLIDVTAVDWPSREKRFDVVYHLLSPKKNQRVRVKI